jgi:hypothetical protein
LTQTASKYQKTVLRIILRNLEKLRAFTKLIRVEKNWVFHFQQGINKVAPNLLQCLSAIGEYTFCTFKTVFNHFFSLPGILCINEGEQRRLKSFTRVSLQLFVLEVCLFSLV